jgi:hypothetical protein
MTVEAVLSNCRGLVIAPAGCGKTHLITETLRINAPKPYLVLTHTTAGVAALKIKLKRLSVPHRNFVVATIDGWARQVANYFPTSCNIRFTPENPSAFYPELRRNVSQYVSAGNLTEIISSTYSRLLVDEYQDCDVDQHALICSLSEILPTTIFGDPLQCIFNFGGPMPCWETDVKKRFPLILELNTPWRWINTGTHDLGQWILGCRYLLQKGTPIDLLSCPVYVNWIQLTGNIETDSRNQIQAQFRIRNENESNDSLLVIGDSRNPRSRHYFASVSSGIDVVEPVDLADITDIASNIDILKGVELADHLLTSISLMMTGVGKANLMKRIAIILAGRNRTPANQIELAIVGVIENSNPNSIANLLSSLELSPDTRLFRRSAFYALKDTIALSISNPLKTTRQAAETIREKRRHYGDRRIPKRAIGSTLLLKGLEADHSLILNAGAMNLYNLYVALSRGAKSITIFSNTNVIP